MDRSGHRLQGGYASNVQGATLRGPGEPRSDGILPQFIALRKESAEWLGNQGIVAFGVEAVSPGRPGKHNFAVHLVCRDMGFTHYEGLTNLDQVVNKGRFTFIAFPLKIRGGTGSPVRAVAVLND